MTLVWPEHQYYRDQLRQARYAALADSEGFLDICFAIEELGVRLTGKQSAMSDYEGKIGRLVPAKKRKSQQTLALDFSAFSALYQIVRTARNDAMHTGSYARHITGKAIELCLLLEDSIMANKFNMSASLLDYMVREPISVDSSQPLAKARNLMLTHSFSNLPVRFGADWLMLTDSNLSRFLALTAGDRGELLGKSLAKSKESGLVLSPAKVFNAKDNPKISEIFSAQFDSSMPNLCLIVDGEQLRGVISPFELM